MESINTCQKLNMKIIMLQEILEELKNLSMLNTSLHCNECPTCLQRDSLICYLCDDDSDNNED